MWKYRIRHRNVYLIFVSTFLLFVVAVWIFGENDGDHEAGDDQAGDKV
jgi:hypothetical protein